MSKAPQAYRKLLTAFRSTKSASSGDELWSSARDMFRRTDLNFDVEKRCQLAEDYAELLTSIKFHKDMLTSYCIGVEETSQREQIKKVAASVGLKISD